MSVGLTDAEAGECSLLNCGGSAAASYWQRSQLSLGVRKPRPSFAERMNRQSLVSIVMKGLGYGVALSAFILLGQVFGRFVMGIPTDWRDAFVSALVWPILFGLFALPFTALRRAARARRLARSGLSNER
jgi:hypothetical protein